MKKYNYIILKAAYITMRNAAERKGSWWKNFARYAEIAKRKLWRIEIGLLACLFLTIGGCQTFKGAMDDTAWLLKTGSNNIQIHEK